MEDPRWDHYVWRTDPGTGITTSERVAGYGTATHLKETYERMGFWRVHIESRRAHRHKEQQASVTHGRLQ